MITVNRVQCTDQSDISTHYFVLTFPIIPPAIAISGLIAMMTRVSFHPYTKPMINPTKTKVMDMMNIPIF